MLQAPAEAAALLGLEQRRAGAAVVAGTTAFSLTIIGTTVVSVALPAIGRDLDSSVAGLQWVSNAYTLLFGSLLLSMGALCDRRGARRIMLLGIGVFLAGAMVATAASVLWVLLAGQVLLGTGAAALMPAALALISHAHPGHAERARAIGIFASASAVAIGLGPVLGGLLIEGLGWRAVFVMDIPIALLIAALVVRLGETPLRPAHRADLAGQLTGILALGSLTLGFIEAGESGWGAPGTIAALAVAVAAGAAFLAVEERSDAPMLPLSLLEPRGFRVALGAGAVVNFCVYGMFFILSLYLQDLRGLTALQTGLVFLAQIGTASLTGLPASRHTGHAGPLLPTVAGCALCGAGCLLMAVVGAGTPLIVILVALALVGGGGGAAIPALTTAVVSGAPREQVGTATAAFTAGRQTGAVLGVAVLGAMVNTGTFTTGLHTAAFASAGALAACATLCAVLLRKERPA